MTIAEFVRMFKNVRFSLGGFFILHFLFLTGFSVVSFAEEQEEPPASEVPSPPEEAPSPPEAEVPSCHTGADCVDSDPCTQDHCENGVCTHSPSTAPGCPDAPSAPEQPPNEEEHHQEGDSGY